MKEIINSYYKAGLHIFPVSSTKTPLCRWADYRDAQTKEDIQKIFNCEYYGIGLICEQDIEVVDIDTKNDPNKGNPEKAIDTLLFNQINAEMPDLLDRVAVQKTVSGGWHIIYRAKNRSGNTKLARLQGQKEAVLETRGQGGYIVIAPTQGYSVELGSLEDIPYITDDERNRLIAMCVSFDQTPETKKVYIPKPVRKEVQVENGKTPWDDYCENGDVLSVLLHHGWKIARENSLNYLLTRPNKSEGVSASLRKSDNKFYCFTSSTSFSPSTGYSAYAVYTELEHKGDFSESAKKLYADGYGDRIVKQDNKQSGYKPLSSISSMLPEEQAKPKIDEKKIDDVLSSMKFDFHQPINESNTILNVHIQGQRFKIAALGNLVVVAGGQKSRKSTLGGAMISSSLSNTKCLGFTLDRQGKNILYFDTEQPFERFQKSQHRIYGTVGLTTNHENYFAYCLRGLSKKERLAAIEKQIASTPNVGIVMIDGIVDLVNDYNDLKESSEIVERLMQITDKYQILMIVVLHVTKTSGQLRGHLGTELQNKADAVIETAKSEQEGWTTVTCRETREIPFTAFAFTQTKEGYPCLELPSEDTVDWNAHKGGYQSTNYVEDTPF